MKKACPDAAATGAADPIVISSLPSIGTHRWDLDIVVLVNTTNGAGLNLDARYPHLRTVDEPRRLDARIGFGRLRLCGGWSAGEEGQPDPERHGVSLPHGLPRFRMFAKWVAFYAVCVSA